MFPRPHILHYLSAASPPAFTEKPDDLTKLFTVLSYYAKGQNAVLTIEGGSAS